MKKFRFKITVHAVLIGVFAAAALWLLLHQYPNAAILVFILFLFFLFKLIQVFNDILRDFKNFVEAIQYRDFSQHFSIKKAPGHLRFFRTGFNEIVTGYKKLSSEKELQYQYLQNVLELVDTAIMAFEPNTGKVVWVNAQMKTILSLPSIRNVDRIQRMTPKLYAAFYTISPMEQQVISVQLKESQEKLLLTANTFITDGKSLKLVALQNVDEALDITETEAWNKLLRVLTHEIMNSIAPISSLANTLLDRLNKLDPATPVSATDYHDLQDGMETIKTRSNGLMRFSSSYRNLNKIGQVNLSEFYIRDVFENLATLMQPSLLQKEIDLEIILPNPNLKIDADRQLLEQLIINLLLNAIDAVKDCIVKEIELAGSINEKNQTIIRITDSGKGMEQQIIDRIFIPFFSTKKAGSGIGLSLCKQIMMLHKGAIQVKSSPDQGTAFTMSFPNTSAS